MKRASLTGGVVFLLVFLPSLLPAQEVGDQVVLASSNSAGVPVHPGPTDNSYVRWANGTDATVISTDSPRGWLKVESGTSTSWVVRTYVFVLLELGQDEVEDPEAEILSYVVGTWNIEYLKGGKTRGFPDYTYNPPGPTYPPRKQADYQRIASVIKGELQAAILILNEINGREDETTSAELDRLVGILGPNWAYELTESGGQQRVAMLYDERKARREACFEIGVPHEEQNGRDVFEKDPLLCRFTFLAGDGAPMNALVMIGLHLAQGDGRIPAGEMDLLIGGDLNASRYGSSEENFWTGFDQDGFHIEVLAPEDGTEYPGTRLAGRPALSSESDRLPVRLDGFGRSSRRAGAVGGSRQDRPAPR